MLRSKEQLDKQMNDLGIKIQEISEVIEERLTLLEKQESDELALLEKQENDASLRIKKTFAKALHSNNLVQVGTLTTHLSTIKSRESLKGLTDVNSNNEDELKNDIDKIISENSSSSEIFSEEDIKNVNQLKTHLVELHNLKDEIKLYNYLKDLDNQSTRLDKIKKAFNLKDDNVQINEINNEIKKQKEILQQQKPINDEEYNTALNNIVDQINVYLKKLQIAQLKNKIRKIESKFLIDPITKTQIEQLTEKINLLEETIDIHEYVKKYTVLRRELDSIEENYLIIEINKKTRKHESEIEEFNKKPDKSIEELQERFAATKTNIDDIKIRMHILAQRLSTVLQSLEDGKLGKKLKQRFINWISVVIYAITNVEKDRMELEGADSKFHFYPNLVDEQLYTAYKDTLTALTVTDTLNDKPINQPALNLIQETAGDLLEDVSNLKKFKESLISYNQELENKLIKTRRVRLTRWEESLDTILSNISKEDEVLDFYKGYITDDVVRQLEDNFKKLKQDINSIEHELAKVDNNNLEQISLKHKLLSEYDKKFRLSSSEFSAQLKLLIDAKNQAEHEQAALLLKKTIGNFVAEYEKAADRAESIQDTDQLLKLHDEIKKTIKAYRDKFDMFKNAIPNEIKQYEYEKKINDYFIYKFPLVQEIIKYNIITQSNTLLTNQTSIITNFTKKFSLTPASDDQINKLKNYFETTRNKITIINTKIQSQINLDKFDESLKNLTDELDINFTFNKLKKEENNKISNYATFKYIYLLTNKTIKTNDQYNKVYENHEQYMHAITTCREEIIRLSTDENSETAMAKIRAFYALMSYLSKSIKEEPNKPLKDVIDAVKDYYLEYEKEDNDTQAKLIPAYEKQDKNLQHIPGGLFSPKKTEPTLQDILSWNRGTGLGTVESAEAFKDILDPEREHAKQRRHRRRN